VPPNPVLVGTLTGTRRSVEQASFLLRRECLYCYAPIAFDPYAPHYICGLCKQWFGLDTINIPSTQEW